MYTNNCQNFAEECIMLLLGTGIPKEVETLPQEFLRSQYGQQVAPLMQQMVENLALNSN